MRALRLHERVNRKHSRACTQKFSPGENFRQFCHRLSMVKFYHMNILSYISHYLEDMTTFIALAKICFTEYFTNTNISGLGEIFIQRNFSHIRYMNIIIYRSHEGYRYSVLRRIQQVYPLPCSVLGR